MDDEICPCGHLEAAPYGPGPDYIVSPISDGAKCCPECFSKVEDDEEFCSFGCAAEYWERTSPSDEEG